MYFNYFVAGKSDDIVPETEKLFMEGQIVQKLECRPIADPCYMQLKRESIRKASQPVRKVQSLGRVVHTFKPVSDHKHNVIIFYIYFNSYDLMKIFHFLNSSST